VLVQDLGPVEDGVAWAFCPGPVDIEETIA